jgi:hypothetical protein
MLCFEVFDLQLVVIELFHSLNDLVTFEQLENERHLCLLGSFELFCNHESKLLNSEYSLIVKSVLLKFLLPELFKCMLEQDSVHTSGSLN